MTGKGIVIVFIGELPTSSSGIFVLFFLSTDEVNIRTIERDPFGKI